MFLWDDEGDSANAVQSSAHFAPLPSYNASQDALSVAVTPSAPEWHFRVEFSWRGGILSTSTRYEWGEVHSPESRLKASTFLERKLKVEEILVLGIRPLLVVKRGRGKEEEEEEKTTPFSFLLETKVRKHNNEEGEGEEEEEEGEEEGEIKRRKRKESLNWEEYGENGFLIKICEELDLTTEFLISSSR